jgi:hypothetical protein
LRDRGGGDALKALAVYNDSQIYAWTGSRAIAAVSINTRSKATR